MFWLSIPAGLVVVVLASTTTAVIAAILYALSVMALFGASAAYHRGAWSEAARSRMQRLDRAMIFVLIAGSASPVVLITVRPTWGITLLALTWTLAVIGVTLTLARWDFFRRNGGYFYVGFGWLMALTLPLVLHHLTTTEFWLLFAGGIVYTVGAINFGLHRPRLDPTVFGYHEVWHVMTVIAAACHYALVVMLVRG